MSTQSIPEKARPAELKSVMLATLTTEDMKEITDALIEKAKEGDIRATRLLFSYTLGKPGADHIHFEPANQPAPRANPIDLDKLREELRPKTPKERHEERKRARKRLKRQQRARPAPSPNGKNSNPSEKDQQIKDTSSQQPVM